MCELLVFSKYMYTFTVCLVAAMHFQRKQLCFVETLYSVCARWLQASDFDLTFVLTVANFHVNKMRVKCKRKEAYSHHEQAILH